MSDYVTRTNQLRRIRYEILTRRWNDGEDGDDKLTDSEFYQRYRFTRRGFEYIFQLLKNDLSDPITNRGNPIPPRTQLKVALRFFATGCFQIVIGDLLKLSQTSVSRIVAKVSNSIAKLRTSFIKFPEGNEAKITMNKFFQIGGFPQVVGCLDGTHIAIEVNAQNKEIYRCRKSFTSLNIQAICDANLRFTNIVARWPGSTHDSRIFENSLICSRFENGELQGLLLGDMGYPCRSFLLTPFRTPNNPPERRYNFAHAKTRSTIERVFGVWKRRFPCLKLGLLLKLSTIMSTIVATAVLHNIAIDIQEPDPDDDSDAFDTEDAFEINFAPHAMANAIRRTIVQQYFQ